jgi:NitT/TauT family transport system substrate-binding protein
MIRRREFLEAVTLGGAASLLGAPRAAVAEPPPETTRVRLFKFPGICLAPQYVAEDLLRGEGFTDVQYLEFPGGPGMVYEKLPAGVVDFSQWYGVPFIQEIDAGKPIVILGGVHAGCQEIFANEGIRAIRDLKGKSITVPFSSPANTVVAAMLAYVGLDHRKDVQFVDLPGAEGVQQFAEGKIDAIAALPPIPQELRARKIGHSIVNMAVDRPWSQYFCCMFIGNRDFVKKHPVASKRALRAILKADQICAAEPERVARAIVERGYTKSYDYALQTLKDVPYGKWRQYDPEDTVRFHSLRLREAGLIKSTPQKILAAGTNWRFVDELKKELKG